MENDEFLELDKRYARIARQDIDRRYIRNTNWDEIPEVDVEFSSEEFDPDRIVETAQQSIDKVNMKTVPTADLKSDEAESISMMIEKAIEETSEEKISDAIEILEIIKASEIIEAENRIAEAEEKLIAEREAGVYENLPVSDTNVRNKNCIPENIEGSDGIVGELGEVSDKIPFYASLRDFGPVLSNYWELLRECIGTGDLRPCNLIITSIAGNGKSSLATQIAEAVIATGRNSVSDLFCRLDATELDRRDIPGLYRNHTSGVIFIENAFEISDESILSLKLLMEVGDRHPLVIIELRPEEVETFLERMDYLKERFTQILNIPILKDEELAEFAVFYANSLKFNVDNMALLKIHSLIIDRQSYTHHVNLAEMVEFVDDAIEVSGKRLIRKLIFSRSHKEMENPVLTENDFKRK